MTHTKQCASGSVVEHLLAKEGVAGSIPVSRSSYAIKMGTLTGAHFYCISEPSPGLESSISRLPPRSLLLCFAKRCPQDTRNPSRAFFALFKGYSRVFNLFVRLIYLCCILCCISEPSPGLEGSISRLPPRSLLLCFAKRCPQDTRNPSHAFFDIFRSFLCLYIYIYIWEILKLKHFPKKLIPYIKI